MGTVLTLPNRVTQKYEDGVKKEASGKKVIAQGVIGEVASVIPAKSIIIPIKPVEKPAGALVVMPATPLSPHMSKEPAPAQTLLQSVTA